MRRRIGPLILILLLGCLLVGAPCPRHSPPSHPTPIQTAVDDGPADLDAIGKHLTVSTPGLWAPVACAGARLALLSHHLLLPLPGQSAPVFAGTDLIYVLMSLHR